MAKSKKDIREWLNEDKDLTAFVSYSYGDGTLKIADCRRSIELEFFIYEDASSVTSANKVCDKVDKLLSIIKDVRKDVYKKTRIIERNLSK